MFCTQVGVVKDLTETGPPLGRLDQGCREECESESEHWDNEYSDYDSDSHLSLHPWSK